MSAKILDGRRTHKHNDWRQVIMTFNPNTKSLQLHYGPAIKWPEENNNAKSS